MTDDRAVSSTVNYVLGLGIAFALVTGLLLAGGNFVQDQRESSIRTELEVVGEHVSADIMMADRLNGTAGGDGTIRVRRSLPNRVSGSPYVMAIEGGEDPQLVLETDSPAVTVEVAFTNTTAVETSRVSGGPVTVNRTDAGTLRLEGGNDR